MVDESIIWALSWFSPEMALEPHPSPLFLGGHVDSRHTGRVYPEQPGAEGTGAGTPFAFPPSRQAGVCLLEVPNSLQSW